MENFDFAREIWAVKLKEEVKREKLTENFGSVREVKKKSVEKEKDDLEICAEKENVLWIKSQNTTAIISTL